MNENVGTISSYIQINMVVFADLKGKKEDTLNFFCGRKPIFERSPINDALNVSKHLWSFYVPLTTDIEKDPTKLFEPCGVGMGAAISRASTEVNH